MVSTLFSNCFENGVRYLNGDISLDEAANAVMQQVNLYLAE